MLARLAHVNYEFELEKVAKLSKQVVILKTGSTYPSLVAERGDFEDWVRFGLGSGCKPISVVDATDGSELPSYTALGGVVITGSHAQVTDHEDWSERAAEWLREAAGFGIPILGICYGHQLLAYALGGLVGDNPNGLEFGTVVVHLDQAAAADRLLGGLNNPLQVHVCHRQTVLRLPVGARRLAYSELDPTQAFVVGDCAWGVQFHPEFEAASVIAYIDQARDALAAGNKDPDRLIASCVDTPYGSEILGRFARIAMAGLEQMDS